MKKWIQIICMSLVLLLAISCQTDDKNANKENHLKRQFSEVITQLNARLPSGWSATFEKIDVAPFQWEVKGRPFGHKLSFLKSSKAKKVKDRPYADLYDKSERQEERGAQMIRYLYESIEGGYRYGMMVRSHPAEVEAITDQFVVVRPSTMTGESDESVNPEVTAIFAEFFLTNKLEERPVVNYWGGENQHQFLSVYNELKSKSKKALMLKYKEGAYEGLWLKSY